MVGTIPEFHLDNIIGIDYLDLPVRPMQSLHGDFDILVLDPGKMVGWAGVRSDVMPQNALDVSRDGEMLWRYNDHIEVGQGPWYECLNWDADPVYVEHTPFAAKRTFDSWPIRFDGAVRAKIYPKEPFPVMPTNLKVAAKWYKLPKGHGLGLHAKDALAHLLWVLVREASR